DHVGENAKGVIFNGADDNASGTGVLSELARSIASGPALKRSVMFIHFTGEEDGLLGSGFFVNNPTIPFGNIACMLNFDMVGQGYGAVGIAGGHQLGAPWYEYYNALPAAEHERIKLYREDGYAGSDNGPFMQSGVPTLSFWSRGDHPFYHNYTDDSEFIVDSVLTNVGHRAESLIRFIADYTEPLASRSDSLRNIARTATTLNLRGFFVDPSGSLPKLSALTAAWLQHDAFIPVAEMTARAAEIHYVCKERNLTSSGLAEAVNAYANDKFGVFLSIPEASFVGRTPQEAITLVRQGLSLVSLVPGNGKSGGKMSDEIQRILLDAGLYAEVPLDFGAPARISTWKDHAIVTARLADFAGIPEEIRESLLTSEALLVLEVEPDITSEQIESIRSGRQRQVHLNFGNAYPELRENEIKSAIRKLYGAEMSRDDILLLSGGNLRRFFKS
ncbi:M28 family peptidase, partial [bacterium]|nr:M28 family peptidase [bacterium]